MIIDGVYIGSLLKAFRKFESFRLHTHTEHEKAGTIQAFEYCFELVWKTMKRLLSVRGLNVNSPREVFRLATLENFIHDPEVWFEFLNKRNLTVHTYEEKAVEEILSSLENFSHEVKNFLKSIGVPDDVYG